MNTRELWVTRAGTVPYGEALRMQRTLAEGRTAGDLPDVLLLLEHPPVYTRGRRATSAELPMGESWYRRQGIEVAETDRGGRATYHGPGQIVAYPIVSLPELELGVHDYVSLIERAMIEALGDRGVEARVFAGLTGVWIGAEPPPTGAARKIGSIGVHVKRGITTHGLAINVNNDLQPFEWIVPCGLEAVRMTSLSRELGAEQDLDHFAGALAERLAEVLGRKPTARSLADLPVVDEAITSIA